MLQDKKIALLIDAENITNKYRDIIFREITKYGTATYRRIYGDFVNNRNINWTQADFSKYSLTPVQQYSYTTGKNSSDITLVIDAMDILYSGNIDMFCIVASDSDYTKLVSRLREAGLGVIGMGETKTPQSLRAACEKFIPLDSIYKTENKLKERVKSEDKPKSDSKTVKTDLSDESDIAKPARKTTRRTTRSTQVQSEQIKDERSGNALPTEHPSDNDTDSSITPIEEIISLICDTILPDLETDSGWANLSDVGNRLTKLIPDFDPRTYGFEKLSKFVKEHKESFEVDKRPGENHTSIYYIRANKILKS